MKHMKFQEYLDSNKKLKTSGTVKTVADYEGKTDTKPAKEKKHKDAGGKGQVGEAKPYKGGTDAKDPNKGKDSGGFAHKGDSKLKYEPKTDVPAKVGEGGKKKASWPKTKMQEWLEKTKGLSLAEFTKTVRNEATKGLDECACQESQPHNAIKDTVEVCKCNKRHLSSLVREMKRNNLFVKLFAEMVQHPEAYAALAMLMEKDESVARKLVKALNEDVGTPMGDESGALVPMKKKKKPSLGMDMGSDDMGSDDMDGETDDMGSDDMDSDSMGDDDMESGDMDGETDDMDSDDMEAGDDDMGSDDMGSDDMGASDMDGVSSNDMNMKPKKKKGMSHLLGAMKNQGAMGM